MNNPICLIVFFALLFGATVKTDAQWYNIFSKEVNIKDLAIKETSNGPYFYYEGELFTGTVFHSWDKFEVKNGRINGQFKSYDYANGKLLGEAVFVEGIKEGSFVQYHSNGKIKAKGIYKNNELEGAYISYYTEGNLDEKCTYKNGKLDGPYLQYWSNGNIRKKCNYIAGREDGIYEEYSDYGFLFNKCNYIKGVLNGPYVYYYYSLSDVKDGEVLSKGNYLNGKKDGYWVENDLTEEFGKISYSEKVYNNGKEIKSKETVVDVETGEKFVYDAKWQDNPQSNSTNSKNETKSNSESNSNSDNPLVKRMNNFLKVYPCISEILDDGVFMEITKNNNIVFILKHTGNADYDATGGLGFFINGIVYKINQPMATGSFTCNNNSHRVNSNLKELNVKYKDNLSSTVGDVAIKAGDGNTKTGIGGIQIKWQTDANGNNVYVNSGTSSAHENGCDNKPLPHEKGCFSAEIAQVQECIGDVYVDGILNDVTIEKLKSLGYDTTQGLTLDTYNAVMTKCGKAPQK